MSMYEATIQVMAEREGEARHRNQSAEDRAYKDYLPSFKPDHGMYGGRTTIADDVSYYEHLGW